MVATAIALAGLAVAGYSAYNATQSQSAAAQTSQQQSRLQRQEIKERKQQMELDAMRKKRMAVRTSLFQRSTALNQAANQGSQYGSGLPGAYGSIQGTAGTAIQGTNQNLEIGRNIFDIKGRESALGALQSQQLGTAATFAGLSQFGFAVANNSNTLGNLFSTATAGSTSGSQSASSGAIYSGTGWY